MKTKTTQFAEAIARIALVAGLIAISGCGSDGLGRVPVEGTVTVDGAPMPSGSIVFVPADGTKGPKAAAIVENGQFSLEREVGPVAGSHVVKVYESEPAAGPLDDPVAFAAAPPETARGNPIAPNYNEASVLRATTTEGEPNQLTFAVERVK